MELSETDLETLREEGYLLIKGIIADEDVSVAHSLLSGWIATGGGGTQLRGRAQGDASRRRGLLSDPRVARLLERPWPLISNLIGGHVSVPEEATQVTAWFPSVDSPGWPPAASDGMDFHIDAPRLLVDAGVLTPEGMARRFEIAESVGPDVPMPDFLATIVVPLTEVRADNLGNLTVLRGSHQLLADHFRASGTSFADYGYGAPPPDVLDYGVSERVVQLRFEPGDLVLLNSQLLHAVVPNRGSDVHITVFFRVGPREAIQRPHLNPWVGWQGLARGTN